MSTPMQVNTTSEGEKQVVQVRGDVDMESSPRMLAEIQHNLRRGAAVEVDLADVTYIDSAGVAVLVQGLKGARKRGLNFRLRNLSKRVIAVLRLAHLLQLFQIDDPGAKG